MKVIKLTGKNNLEKEVNHAHKKVKDLLKKRKAKTNEAVMIRSDGTIRSMVIE